MNVIDTIRTCCREFPGGIEAVAQRIGKSPHTLRHELGEFEGFKLGMNTVLEIMAVTKDSRIASAIAAEIGFTIIQCPHVEDVGREFFPVAERSLRDFGELMATSMQSWADREITPNENKDVQNKGVAAIGAIQTVMRVTEARCKGNTAVAPMLREVSV